MDAGRRIKMLKVFAVEWSTGPFAKRFTNYIVADTAVSARKLMLSGDSVAGVVHGVRRAKEKDSSIPAHYYEW
jgi:hypothetical protein